MTAQAPTLKPSRRYGPQVRKASRVHVCDSCGQEIAEGENHFTRPTRVGRRIETWREHLNCPVPHAPLDYAAEPERKRRSFIAGVLAAVAGFWGR